MNKYFIYSRRRAGIGDLLFGLYGAWRYAKEYDMELIINWKRNGWRTAAGSAVKNKELWVAIDEVRNKLNLVEWRWVKAHNGNPKNEEVDKLARQSAETIKNNLSVS